MKIFGAGAVVLTVVVFGWFFFVQHSDDATEPLSFSSTMEWGADYALYLDYPIASPVLAQWEAGVSLPPPPANDSPETRSELDTLLHYQDIRTEEELSAIHEELELGPVLLGEQTIATYFNPGVYPATAALLMGSFGDLSIIVIKEKKYFDRVRPSYLESALSPAIDNPAHPAYPSGHAAQSHFLALILGELDPARKGAYLAQADEIALHREIAGVHFPSDSSAGKLLAEKVFELLLTDPEFQALFEDAIKEWSEEE